MRNEVFFALRSLGPSSVAELAEALGKSPEALHYHVRALVKADLIRVSGVRPTKRKPEAVFEPLHRDLRLPDPAHNPDVSAANRKAVLAGIRQTTRGFEAATLAAELDPRLRQNMHVIKTALRLLPDDAKRIRALIEEAARLAKTLEHPQGDRLHWSSMFFPEVRRSKKG